MPMNSLLSSLKFLVPPSLRPTELAMRRVFSRAAGTVQAGPFAGMVYPANRAAATGICPAMALGIWEKELHPTIERIREMQPGVVINVGAAGGYYAVGLLLTGITPRVVAFEMDPEMSRQLLDLAQLNRCVGPQLDIRGACDPVSLQSVLLTESRSTVVVLMDVEGYERVLLDPDQVPALRHAYILVEMHNVSHPTTTVEVIEAMKATHQIHRIAQQDRHRGDIPFWDAVLAILPWRSVNAAVGDMRGEVQHWLWMTPLHSRS